MTSIAFQGKIPKPLKQKMSSILKSHETLGDVMQWIGTNEGKLLIEEVINQDEYTLDVLVPYKDGYYIVYDVT